MIVGIGSDLTNIERIGDTIKKYGTRFLNKIFSKAELAEMSRREHISEREYYCMAAKRFAAKEACSKALGTGLRNGTYWRNMEVIHLSTGKPTLKLTGSAFKNAQKLCREKNANIQLTMTDDYPWAQAFVVIEAI